MTTIKQYRHPLSGHSHRAELLISLLGLDAEIIDVDLMKGEHKQPEFLAKNPQGQVPVLQVGDSNKNKHQQPTTGSSRGAPKDPSAC